MLRVLNLPPSPEDNHEKAPLRVPLFPVPEASEVIAPATPVPSSKCHKPFNRASGLPNAVNDDILVIVLVKEEVVPVLEFP